MKLALAAVVGVCVGLGSMADASAKPHRYVGVHAINASDGMCYIEAAHIHGYAPPNASVMFRTTDGRHHFVGDPVVYGYDGPRHAYHGHHPIHIEENEHFCYIDGPHFHHHTPVVVADFEIKGDIHWYVGPRGPKYKKHLYKRKRINRVYAGYDYVRPVVLVDPPAAYADVVVVAPAARVDVVAPSARVDVVAPTAHADVQILLPAFSVGIGGHGHAHVGGHHRHKSHRKWHKKARKRHKRAHKRAYKRHKRAHKRAHKRERKASKRRGKRDRRGRRWKF